MTRLDSVPFAVQRDAPKCAIGPATEHLQGSCAWVFYLPLALVGLPPAVFLALSSFNTLYQFWIHTRLIGRLGPLEWIFNTPSHHRVHHARNPEYIDKNHGGTLIVWDRLFGTFGAEKEEPVYGITRPLRAWNPLWANLHYWVELGGLARRAARWSDRLRVFVKPPGWRPRELGGFQAPPAVDRATYRKFETPVPAGLAAYVATQFVLLLPPATLLLWHEAHLPRAALVAGLAVVALGTISLTALFERRRAALGLELARLAALAAVAMLSTPAGVVLPDGVVPGVVAGAAGSTLWLLRYRTLFVPATSASVLA